MHLLVWEIRQSMALPDRVSLALEWQSCIHPQIWFHMEAYRALASEVVLGQSTATSGTSHSLPCPEWHDLVPSETEDLMMLVWSAIDCQQHSSCCGDGHVSPVTTDGYTPYPGKYTCNLPCITEATCSVTNLAIFRHYYFTNQCNQNETCQQQRHPDREYMCLLMWMNVSIFLCEIFSAWFGMLIYLGLDVCMFLCVYS